jgi:hypothetical protein
MGNSGQRLFQDDSPVGGTDLAKRKKEKKKKISFCE